MTKSALSGLVKPMGARGVIAVVPVGFGCPADLADVEPYLSQIFSDPVASPLAHFGPFLRPAARFLAKLCRKRTTLRYLTVSRRLTSRQMVADLAARLEAYLRETGSPNSVVFPAMRYGEPSLAEVIPNVAATGVRDMTIIPLFPHRATVIYESINTYLQRILCRQGCTNLRVRMTGPWYESHHFVTGWVEAIREMLGSYPAEERERVHLLFTAHAVPVKQTTTTDDDYQDQVRKSSRLINDSLGGTNPISIAYQSPGAFGKWTGPTIEEELKHLGRQGVRYCLIVPIGFPHDCVETWCDIDIEILPKTKTFGIDRLKRVTPPFESVHFVKMLAGLLFNIDNEISNK